MRSAHLVVVPLIKLAGLVPHNLQVLAMIVRRARYIVDPARHGVHVLIGEAAGEIAPALVGGTHRVELVASERAVEPCVAAAR